MPSRPWLRWTLLLAPLLALGVGAHVWIYLCQGEQSTDTAINVQFLTLALSHGWAPSGLLGVTAFGDHVDPLLLLPAPAFLLAPSAVTLQVVKTGFLLAGVPAIAQLAGRRLGRAGAHAAVFAYLAGPMFWLAVVADYHVETLAAGLIPWLLLAYDRERLGACLALALLVAGGKENLPLVIGGLGILAFADGRGPRWWGSLCGLGAAVFLLDVLVILPACAPPGGAHHAAFEPLRTPAGWTAAFLRASLWRWLGLLLLSALALPLLRLRATWPLLPLLLQHGLSARESERAFDFHYLAPALPLLAYAAIRGAERLRSRPRFLGVALGVVAAALLVLLGPAGRLSALRPQPAVSLLAALPAEGPVWVSRSTATRLATRHPIYLLECLTLGRYPDRPGWRFTPPDPLPTSGLVDARDGPFLRLPPGVTAVDAIGDLLLLGKAEQSPRVRRLPSDAAFSGEAWVPAADAPLRLQAGKRGRYRLALDRPRLVLPNVVVRLVDAQGRPRAARVHRLAYGLLRGSGVWEVRYRPPAFARSGPFPATLYAKLDPRDPRWFVLTSYSGNDSSQAATSSGER